MNLTPYQLIVFDKDGTLIDFDAMWAGWVEQLAANLERAAGRALAAEYFTAVGYDAQARRTLPGGPLAVITIADLYALTLSFLQGRGVPAAQASAALSSAWFVPDPIETARPCADLADLFGRLQARDLRLAIATTDDRSPTLATLEALGVTHLLDALVCGDDGVAVKPAPDMVLEACRVTGTRPERTVVVGDSVADLRMARAAGALAVGVLTGVSPAATLQPAADLVLESVASLLPPARLAS